MDLYWGVAVIALVGSGAGSFLGSYLKKKGENLATHEDIDKLVDQVRAVTQTTREIEAKISNEVWDRQKRWELKRDAIFEMVRELGSWEGMIGDFASIYQATRATESKQYQQDKRLEAHRNHSEMVRRFERAKMVVLLVCSEETKKNFNDFELIRTRLVQDITRDGVEVGDKEFGDCIRAGIALRDLLRRELER